MDLREQVVHDEEEACPYREGQVARMPLRWQLRSLSPEEMDASMERGDRRVGRMLYSTACPSCKACEPIRIAVDDFELSKSQRRVWRKNQDIRVEIGRARFSEERLDLYNRHKLERGLARNEREMVQRGYESWFLHSCCQTLEMRYSVDDRLIGVGIVDVGRRDSSSVYFFFDPDESRRSLGVFSVLVEAAWLRGRGGRFHYLGLYVEDCRHLSYKASYHPHQRRTSAGWQDFPTRIAGIADD
jgi:arginine-tRNA-protein transferase